MFTTFVANVVGPARSEKIGDKQYLIVPATILVPGVLNGSKGALYYPPDEVAKQPGVWNGYPLVAYHPTVNGTPVSARHPKVLHDSGLGFVFNDTLESDGRRRVEAWFDVEATARYDQKLSADNRILPRVRNGRPIELSTGLFTDNVPVRDGKDPKSGRDYTAIARNYRPDHIAVLPDMKGACSVTDGCGIHNAEKDNDSRVWSYKYLRPLTNAGKKKLSGGQWVTIAGAHVYIKGGKAVAGPKELTDHIGQVGSDKASGKTSGKIDSSVQKPSASPHQTEPLNLGRGRDEIFPRYLDRVKGEFGHLSITDASKLGLTAEQKQAVRDYGNFSGTSGAKRLNNMLRGGKPLKADLKEKVDLLDSAISKSEVHKDVLVGRSTSALEIGLAGKSVKDFEDLVGKTVTNKGYTSTRLDTSSISGFGDAIPVMLRVPAGTKAIAHLHEKDTNAELTLHRNTKYRIDRIEHTGDGFQPYRIHATVVSKDHDTPTHNEDTEMQFCVLNDDEICQNCGGKGGKPGPCPRSKSGTQHVKKVKSSSTKEPRLTKKAASAKAKEALQKASEAEKSGDTNAARNHRAAAYGFNLAAKHLADKDKVKAAAVYKMALDFAGGQKKLSTNTATPIRVAKAEYDLVTNQVVLEHPQDIEMQFCALNDEEVCTNCGGKGGKKGPCPSGAGGRQFASQGHDDDANRPPGVGKTRDRSKVSASQRGPKKDDSATEPNDVKAAAALDKAQHHLEKWKAAHDAHASATTPEAKNAALKEMGKHSRLKEKAMKEARRHAKYDAARGQLSYPKHSMLPQSSWHTNNSILILHNMLVRNFNNCHDALGMFCHAGSKGAADASRKANNSGSSAAHTKAFKEHKAAEQHHREEGNDTIADMHKSAAAFHKRRAFKAPHTPTGNASLNSDYDPTLNSGDLMERSDMERSEMITFLVTNCPCMARDEEKLKTLSTPALKAIKEGEDAKKSNTAVTNALKTLPGVPIDLTINSAPELITNRIKPGFEAATAVEKQTRDAIITKLVSNAKLPDGPVKEHFKASLATKSVADLQEMEKSLPQPQNQQNGKGKGGGNQPQNGNGNGNQNGGQQNGQATGINMGRLPNFTGAGNPGGTNEPTDNQNQDEEEPLGLPVMNWAKERELLGNGVQKR